MKKPNGIIINGKTLQQILKQHRLWLEKKGDERTDLRYVDLCCVDLSYVDLSYADLSCADLRYADLSYADLRYADLSCADLCGANLSYADLRGANIDFSQLNLSCKGLNFKIDERQAKQLMYHIINLMQYSNLDVNKVVKKHMYKWLKDSHIVKEHNMPILKKLGDELDE